MDPDDYTTKIYNFLHNLDVCQRCILRVFGVLISSSSDYYRNPEAYFNSADPKIPTNVKVKIEGEGGNKKFKPNTCITCLDMFSDAFVERFIEEFLNKESKNIGQCTYDSFSLNISVPMCISIRFHSILVHLKNNFSDFEAPTEVEYPVKILKHIIGESLARRINKQCNKKSFLDVTVFFGYEDDEKEVCNIKNLDRERFMVDNSKRKKMFAPPVGRAAIAEILLKCSDDDFKKNFPVPPLIPDKGVFIQRVEWKAQPLYLGGRYLKFARNISQTPWIFERMNNLQDILFDILSKHLSCDKSSMTFTASGREDADVRMLGTGRPFYVKIDDPKHRKFSEETRRAVEREVVETGLVAVVDLQVVHEADIKIIKIGELKTKTYKALCHTKLQDVKPLVQKINMLDDNEHQVIQQTPLRVMHRRTVADRVKYVYNMVASEVEGYPNLFELEVKTAAGTYVKEFVNGDFERTVPSLRSILNCPVDILALDVTNIDVHWPPNSVYEEELEEPVGSDVKVKLEEPVGSDVRVKLEQPLGSDVRVKLEQPVGSDVRVKSEQPNGSQV